MAAKIWGRDTWKPFHNLKFRSKCHSDLREYFGVYNELRSFTPLRMTEKMVLKKFVVSRPRIVSP
jgi:hypothetical protein